AFPSYRAWGYRPAECPARDTLGGGWIGASALSILQSSPSPPPPSGHPPRWRSAVESVTDSSPLLPASPHGLPTQRAHLAHAQLSLLVAQVSFPWSADRLFA